jgi:hypothetical protein
MVQDLIRLAKGMARKAREAFAPTPPRAPRPQLDGRRGYGDGGIKAPDEA